MDNHRFDTLTRSLTTTGSRRGVLGGMLTGVGALLGVLGPEETAAHDYASKCKTLEDKKKRKKCLKKNQQHQEEHRTGCNPGGIFPIPCGSRCCTADKVCCLTPSLPVDSQCLSPGEPCPQ
jgi:hypothetical protein